MLRITWVGHSTVLVELDGVRLLTDPVLRSRLAHLRRVAERRPTPARSETSTPCSSRTSTTTTSTCPRCAARRPLASGRRPAPARARLLRRRGFTRVIRARRRGGARRSVRSPSRRPGRARAARTPFSRDRRRGRLPASPARRAIYFAGDTDLFDGMSELAPGPRRRAAPDRGLGRRACPPGHLDPRARGRGARAAAPARRGPDPLGHLPAVGVRDARRGLLRAPAEEFAQPRGRAGARRGRQTAARGRQPRAPRRRSRQSATREHGRHRRHAVPRPLAPPPAHEGRRLARRHRARLRRPAAARRRRPRLAERTSGTRSTHDLVEYIVAGLALQTVQTTLTALALVA